MSSVRSAGPAEVVPAGRWAVDPARSSVQFAVRHVIGTLRGRFTDFQGVLDVSESGAIAAAGSVRAASIDTKEPVRDGHLRESADFFDVARYPEITFSATRIDGLDGGRSQIFGQFTMRGVTRELALTLHDRGGVQDLDGERTVALELHGELDRRQFGLTWNQLVEAGGVLVGDRVRIALELLAVEA